MQLARIALLFTILFNIVVESPQVLTHSKPNFSGIWNAKIIPTNERSLAEILKISYRDPKLKISSGLGSRGSNGKLMTSRYDRDFVYYTDGRGERQRSLSQNGYEGQTTTQRIDGKIVTTSTIASKQSGRKIMNERTTTLEILADGRTLKETISVNSDGTSSELIRLYDRLEDIASANFDGEWVQKVVNQLLSLIIEHRDPELKVTRREVSEAQDKTETAVYYTDGRGELNDKNGKPVKSVTKWQGDRIVFQLSSTSKTDIGTFEFSDSIAWQITKNGASLEEVSQTRVRSASGGIIQEPKTKRLLFARSEKALPN